MPRKNLIRVAKVPYHVTARSNNREWFQAPLEEVWDAFDRNLAKIQELHEVQIHAFVMMSNHFHLLITPPHADLDVAMRYFLRESCRSINRSAERINHLFGGPYKWSVIRGPGDYLHAYKYIMRNPVKAAICDRVEDYEFSSLNRDLMRFRISRSVLASDLFENRTQLIRWLNIPHTEEENECLRRALKKAEFKLVAHKSKRLLPQALMS